MGGIETKTVVPTKTQSQAVVSQEAPKVAQVATQAAAKSELKVETKVAAKDSFEPKSPMTPMKSPVAPMASPMVKAELKASGVQQTVVVEAHPHMHAIKAAFQDLGTKIEAFFHHESKSQSQGVVQSQAATKGVESKGAIVSKDSAIVPMPAGASAPAPAAPVGPGSAPAPTPANPADPAGPAAPANPANPAGPTTPANPANPADPAAPGSAIPVDVSASASPAAVAASTATH